MGNSRKMSVSPWLSLFSWEERLKIDLAFKPLSVGRSSDVQNMVDAQNPKYIGNLIGHLKKLDLRHLGYRLIEHADKLCSDAVPLLSRHFYHAAAGQFYYRWREIDEFALNRAEDQFLIQISLSGKVAHAFVHDPEWGFIPAHTGFRQMRIIEEKRRNYDAAIELCQTALRQGWQDDWEKHINRLLKKKTKLN